MYTVKFKDDNFCNVSLGNRGKPPNSTEIIHPDGTPLYLVPAYDYKCAIELIVLQSKFDASKSSEKYLQYGYVEHVLDVDDPDMFLLIMADDFGDWHNKISLK